MKHPLPLSALAASILSLSSLSAAAGEWTKHTVMESGRTSTAVAADFDGDGSMDVITSYGGKVSLFRGPDWRERVLHRLPGAKGACIHSAVLDVDGDGDPDWAGSLAKGGPFWLENPGADAVGGEWTARTIDRDIRGIHCLLAADVDGDGARDLIINNFEPEGPLADSIAWFRVPENSRQADEWERYVFAAGDARGGSHYFGFGDIDGDGWGEIAVGAKGKPFEDGNWFAYWKHPGEEEREGAWEKTVLAENQPGATCILPADVDGDGRVDFVASRGHGAGVLWLQAPDWTIREIDPEILSPHSLAVADFDGDGDMDAASCGYESALVRWYQNDGRGNFTLHTIGEEQESYDLRAVDMDGDGDPDLLNAGRATGNVVWYENPLR